MKLIKVIDRTHCSDAQIYSLGKTVRQALLQDIASLESELKDYKKDPKNGLTAADVSKYEKKIDNLKKSEEKIYGLLEEFKKGFMTLF